MNILEYYITQQSNKLWYVKFSSTSGKMSGKTFSYINTNFRSLSSFLVQFNRITSKLGKNRSEWHSYLPSGQEADKHRVVNLANAQFITLNAEKYNITYKGLVLIDLNLMNLSESENWFLLFLLILDYHNDRKFDLILTVKSIFEKLESIGYNESDILKLLSECFYINSKRDLFSKDIFWLISFINDSDFLNLFISSNKNETNRLKEYVIDCSSYKDSFDLIAHKFKNSGVYNLKTFKEDLKVLYFTKILLDNIDLKFEEIVSNVLNEYKKYYLPYGENNIQSFIKNHKSAFLMIINTIKEEFNYGSSKTR